MTMLRRHPGARTFAVLGSLALAHACGGSSTPMASDTGDASGGTTAAAVDDGSSGAPVSGTTASDPGSTSSADDTTGGEPQAIHVTHAFGPLTLPPMHDDVTQCVSWTLDNALAVYVNSVEMANLGAFHHSNWFIVPDDRYPGEDGYWPCADRGFDEISASSQGAVVLFAQSTQSYLEDQTLAPGAVVKIPPHYKVVATLHTLNASPLEVETSLWLTLYPIHPSEVTSVVTALSMQYKDLRIPASRASHFTGNCDLSTPYWLLHQAPLAMRLHYILPHYHYLGNFFEVRVIGGLRDGEVVYSLDGFNGSANGLTFDPPLDLPGATGLSFTCGYDNWRTEDVTWGNGGGEMCVMLALVESDATMGASVDLGNHLVDVVDDVQMYEGTCLGIALNKPADQGMPTPQEVAAPLYLPPVDPDDQGIPPVPQCRESNPAVPPSTAPTLDNVRDVVFGPSCSYSACHGMNAMAGLDLGADDLRGELLDHEVQADVMIPLVEPGDPEGSLLYRLLSRCEPLDDGGQVMAHMPLNAPFLLDDATVALVREWIADGAP